MSTISEVKGLAPQEPNGILDKEEVSAEPLPIGLILVESDLTMAINPITIIRPGLKIVLKKTLKKVKKKSRIKLKHKTSSHKTNNGQFHYND